MKSMIPLITRQPKELPQPRERAKRAKLRRFQLKDERRFFPFRSGLERLERKSRRPAATSPENALGDGGLVDLVDRGLQCLVELFVALLGSQVLGKRAAEGGDQAVVLSELITGVVPAVPA